ncbi:ribonuclease HII [Bacillus taeanensis]|uniref:Ribonuclease HII n=1 Tax=Bacillus taeanensis TaxID=273032 RepID=A0A366XMF5_9BACI|nr:ribonuclease HII [Bacillus taeanensis]RBW67540.1 ribonuclease HII [Bacillus taeanensis]
MKLTSIKEIEQALTAESLSIEEIESLKQDRRKGVQRLLTKWQKQQNELENIKRMFEDMSVYEKDLKLQGKQFIAGVDEVGRGPLAGPVVTAAVILPNEPILGLNDSKKLSKSRREELYKQIKNQAVAIGIGIMSAKEIDQHNIYQATKKAMVQAVNNLTIKPDHLLIDAMELPLPISQTSIIKGDANSISIAAASIVAKVTRDKIMEELSQTYPQYGFEKNAGYGTKEHLNALYKYGVTEEHRKTFSPVKEMITLD